MVIGVKYVCFVQNQSVLFTVFLMSPVHSRVKQQAYLMERTALVKNHAKPKRSG